MRPILSGTAALAAGLLASSLAWAQAASPAAVGDTAKGKVLTNSAGMTLYTFDRDAAGKSNCTAACAQNWPPLTAAASAQSSGDWSVVAREDGGKQWAYKGKPLYTWSKDTKKGDVTGDGVNNVWHLAMP